MTGDVPNVTCHSGIHVMESRQEPVFHAVSREGAHLLVALDVVRAWGRAIHRDGVPPDACYAELYVGMPNRPKLIRCDIGFAGMSRKPKMLITSENIPGVLWGCDL